MLKYSLICFLLLPCFVAAKDKVTSGELNFLRAKFYTAIESEEITYRLENFITQKFSSDVSTYPPVILAYSAAVEALKAKHAFNPYNKVKYLVTSLNRLAEAVAKNGSSLEIRFLRFSILHNIPSILGYSKELNEDLDFLYQALLKKDYSELDSSIQKGIVEFVLRSERLTVEKQTVLEKFYAGTYK